MKAILLLQNILICFALFTLTCCDSDEPTPKDSDVTHRTVLVYMAANNDLSDDAIDDLYEMKAGAQANGLNGGRLLVYLTTPNSSPRLIEILSSGKEITLKTYSSDTSSLTIERMRQVFDDMKTITQANDYGLVLWSHATGWVNDNGVINDQQFNPNSFGQDGSPVIKMKLTSLAKALNDQNFSFIYFDCCHMATIEVAYELRHSTSWIAASATEIGLDGMPYEQNLKCFFAEQPNLTQAVKNTFNYYSIGAEAANNYGCSISLINTSELDQLASSTRYIFSKYSHINNYTPIPYFRTITTARGIFDMHHYISRRCTDSTEFETWKSIFNRVVTVHHTTSKVYNLDASQFHGLGCNIVTSLSGASNYGYNETSWWTDVVKPTITTTQQ